MANRDHKNSDGICAWDHERWPCKVALALQEASAEIRKKVEEDEAWRPKWQAGMHDAADLIYPGA